MKEKNDQQRSKAKQDVTELLGKDEKNKKKSKVSGVAGLSMGGADLGPPIGKGMAPLASLERKPLPGIQPLQSMPGKSSSWGGLPSNIKEADSPTDAVSQPHKVSLSRLLMCTHPSPCTLDIQGDGSRRRQRESGATNRLASSEPIMGGSSRLGDTIRDASRRSGTALSRVNEDSGGNSDVASSDAESEGTAVRGKPGRSRERGNDAESKTISGAGRAQSKLTSRLKGALEPSLANAAEEKVGERSDTRRRPLSSHDEDFKSDNGDLSDTDAQEERDAARAMQQRGRAGGSAMRRPTYVSDPVDDDEEESGPRRRPTSRVLSLSRGDPRDEEEAGPSLSVSSKSERRVKINDAKDDGPRPMARQASRDDGEEEEDLREELEQVRADPLRPDAKAAPTCRTPLALAPVRPPPPRPHNVPNLRPSPLT